MKMKRAAMFFGVLGLGLLAGAQEQEKPENKLTHAAPQVAPTIASSYVSEAEAKATLERIAKSLPGVASHSIQVPAIPLGESDAPVTREQVVLAMDAIFDAVKPHFRFTPAMVLRGNTTFTIADDSKAKPALQKLVKWGFVDRVSNLATSSDPKITVSDFGDAMGLYFCRVSELTHMPNVKFSPYLEKDFGPAAEGEGG